MGPRHLLQMALLLVAQAVLPEASLYCIHLEYWSPDNKSCRSCLELYGPPPSLGEKLVLGTCINPAGDMGRWGAAEGARSMGCRTGALGGRIGQG
jgi:hypothetical protein